MAPLDSIRRLPRAGILLPGLVALLAVADLGTRLIPLRSFAFRPWEAFRVEAGREAPFLPGRRGAWTTVGDLANAGGVPYPADRRREVFTTDANGFRNSGNMVGSGPVGVVLLGDSFVAGAGLSDEQTLAAQLREATGRRVFNAGGLPVWDLERLDAVLSVSGLGAGGIVVYGLSESAALPTAPAPRRTAPARVPPEPVTEESDFGVSRLGVLARRAGSRLAGLARLSPGGDVVRRPLANGDAMLFLDEADRSPGPPEPGAVESWAGLREELGKRGIGLLLLLIPRKDEVYGDLLAEPGAAGVPGGAGEQARALSECGVPVLDLAPALKAAARDGLAARRYVYWRDDTHWSPPGVRLAAAELARALDGARPPAGKVPGG